MTKTLSFAVVHFSVAFTVGYVMTGSVLVGGTMALIEPAINTVAFYMHEKYGQPLSKIVQRETQSFNSQRKT